jgi:integrase
LNDARVRIHRNLSWRKGGKWVIKTTKGEDDVWLALPEFSVHAVRRQFELRAVGDLGRLAGTRPALHDPRWSAVATSIGTPLAKLCALADVPHGIRHQTASALLAAGKSLTDVQYVLRHKNQRLTSDLYRHMADDARGHAAAVLDELSPDR